MRKLGWFVSLVLAALLAACGDGGGPDIGITGVTVDPTTMRFVGGQATVSATVTTTATLTRVYALVTHADATTAEVDLTAGTPYIGTVTVPANPNADGTAQTVTVAVVAEAEGGSRTSDPVAITVAAAETAPAPPEM